MVVLAWDASDGSTGLPDLSSLKSQIPPGSKWVYVAVGKSLPPIADLKARAPYPGAHCLAEPGLGGAVARALKIQQLPYAYVIDGRGKLSGFGAIAELPELIKGAIQ